MTEYTRWHTHNCPNCDQPERFGGIEGWKCERCVTLAAAGEWGADLEISHLRGLLKLYKAMLNDVVSDYGDRCDQPETCVCSLARATRLMRAGCMSPDCPGVDRYCDDVKTPWCWKVQTEPAAGAMPPPPSTSPSR